jgi:transposase-like protein
MDRNGPLIGVRLSDTRDLAAAEACFRSAWTVTGVTPDRITTDGHDAYPRAIRNVFGDQVRYRANRSLNHHLEQDHRSIKQRYRVTGGLNTSARRHASAASLTRVALLHVQIRGHDSRTLHTVATAVGRGGDPYLAAGRVFWGTTDQSPQAASPDCDPV